MSEWLSDFCTYVDKEWSCLVWTTSTEALTHCSLRQDSDRASHSSLKSTPSSPTSTLRLCHSFTQLPELYAKGPTCSVYFCLPELPARWSVGKLPQELSACQISPSFPASELLAPMLLQDEDVVGNSSVAIAQSEHTVLDTEHKF